MADGMVAFTLTPRGGRELAVRLRRAGDRWAAEVAGDAVGLGVARTAREALAAALAPLGLATTRALLADVGLLAPSARVIEIERQ